MSKKKGRSRGKGKKPQAAAQPNPQRQARKLGAGGQLSSDWRLKLRFAGPLMSQASGTLAFGVDTAMQRDYRDNPVLNGSLVRGNLRHALAGFAEMLGDETLVGNVQRWFGKPSEDDFEPHRASLDFDFFWRLVGQPEKSQRRTRIAIDSDSGRVKAQHLQVIEDVFPLGSEPVFTGIITIHHRTGEEQSEILHWLGRALDYLPAMGSFKGIGFGRLLGWELEEVKAVHGKPGSPPRVERIGFELHFDSPFCLGRPRTPDSNRIVSDSVVAGNVLKGVLARKLGMDREKLEKIGFDDLLITHAVPVPADATNTARPLPLPLSLAVVDGERVVDMACVTDAAGLALSQAPVFQPDWKDDHWQKAESAWHEKVPAAGDPPRLLAVRTEINPEHNVAEEGNLFSQECIEPADTVWRGDLELGRVPENMRGALLQKLTEAPLHGIGKTHARARLTLRDAPLVETSLPEPFDTDHYLVLLVTPARLLPPGPRIPAINGHEALEQAYADYWKTLHPDIELLNHFARQELASDWPHRQRHGYTGEHRATWLTRAGSVFLLRVPEGDAREQLSSALRYGLPPAPEADGSEPDWRVTPWLPEHGFGEIVINHPHQLTLRYRPEEA